MFWMRRVEVRLCGCQNVCPGSQVMKKLPRLEMAT